jgi:hypothetical protein
MELCEQLFQATDDEARLRIIRQMYTTGFTALVAFLEGNLLFAMGNRRESIRLLQVSADAGLDYFALARAHLMAMSVGSVLNSKMPFDVRRAYPEAAMIAKNRTPAPLVAQINMLFARKSGRFNNYIKRLKLKV